MDPQTRFQLWTWIIAFVGGFGMLVIVLLAAMWRRHLNRERRLEQQIAERQERQDVHVDTWRTAGERMQPIEPPADPGDDEPNPDEPWREDSRGDTWDRDPDDDEDEDGDREEPWQ